jgi:DnaK suppressor protein
MKGKAKKKTASQRRPKKKSRRPAKAAAKALKSSKAKAPKKRAAFKKEMLKNLIGAKKRLLADVAHKVKAESNIHRFEIGDIYDIASGERERELSLTLGDMERERLHEIDTAIERLRAGEYGICEECGEEIGEERLRALPFTRVCVDCKTKAEKESKLRARLEEEPVGAIEGLETEEEEYS